MDEEREKDRSAVPEEARTVLSYGHGATTNLRLMAATGLGCVLACFLILALLCAGMKSTAPEWLTRALMLALPTFALAGIGFAIAVRRSPHAGPDYRQYALGIFFLGGLEVAILLAIYLSLPTLSVASERANLVKCRRNLEQISTALALYVKSHRAYPPTVAELFLDESWGDESSEYFVCPSSANEKANGHRYEVAAFLATRPANRSYIYLGGNLTPASPKNSVLAYEPLTDHEDEGAHFLFKDGTIKWLKTADAKRMIGQLEGGQNPPR